MLQLSITFFSDGKTVSQDYSTPFEVLDRLLWLATLNHIGPYRVALRPING